MSSTLYLNEKRKYEKLKPKFASAMAEAESCSSSFNKSAAVFEELIVSGKSIAQGTLEDVASNISAAVQILASYISLCDQYIDAYDKLYKEALQKERETAVLRAKTSSETAVESDVGDGEI